MKYKKFIMKNKKIFLLLFILLILFLFLTIYYKEHYSPSSHGKDVLKIIETFCNKHYGETWNMDSLVSYNEKIIFVTIQTKDQTIDFSIQPDSRAIIIENTRGSHQKNTLQQRIFRY